MSFNYNPEDVNDEILLFCAFRYALGRHSYVVGTIVQHIKDNWENIHHEKRYLYKKEIRAYYGIAGYEDRICVNGYDDMDASEWETILNLED